MKVVYRKMQNGKEFMKIMEGMYAVSVLVGGPSKAIKNMRISFTDNKMLIQDYKNDHVSMPSSEQEFETNCKAVAREIKKFIQVKQG